MMRGRPFATPVLTAFFAVLLAVPAGAAPRPAGPGPRVVVEPEHFDFGAARPDRTLSTQFTIRNHGDAVLELGPIASDCACTAALLGARRLEPGASTAVRVSLETRKAKGALERKVIIGTNDPARPKLVLKVRADVQAGK